MTCASCAARVEKKLNKLDGVTAARDGVCWCARSANPFTGVVVATTSGGRVATAMTDRGPAVQVRGVLFHRRRLRGTLDSSPV